MTRRPTFEWLQEARELPEVNPATGARFTISLRDWRGALWAVQVRPARPRPTDAANPFVQKHRLMARSRIEGWLAGLRVPVERHRPEPSPQTLASARRVMRHAAAEHPAEPGGRPGRRRGRTLSVRS
jgi:hypothetical protein